LEKRKVRMTCCPPICGKKKQEGERKKVKKAEKDEYEEVLRKLVPKRFWRCVKYGTEQEQSGPELSGITPE